MVTAFLFWSVLYAVFTEGSLLDRILVIAYGPTHLWFIFMIIGIYMCLPFIRPIAKDDALLKYYGVLSFIFAYAIPSLIMLLNDFGFGLLAKSTNALSSDVANMHMHMGMGFVSYFLLGYYLNKTELSKKQRTVIYVLGVVGAIATFLLSVLAAMKTQAFSENYMGEFSVNVLFEAMAVFTWFKYRTFDNAGLNKIIQTVGKYSFGIYLVHALIIKQLDTRLGLNTLSYPCIISVVVNSVIVFIISFMISAILNHIPVLNKHIV